MLAPSYSREIKRQRLQVRGIVQGVGFRPFVYNLARRLGLAGFVFNCSSGVVIEVEGLSGALQSFQHALGSQAPPLARIESIAVEELQSQGETGFVIQRSVPEEGRFVLVSPDVATCDDCWHDFTHPQDRRRGYPFTNCTNCGPRYTIIQDIPYDRPKTTMAAFRMCAQCRSEYDDAADRRFHAQPNACAACGPSLALVSKESLAAGESFEFGGDALAIIHEVRQRLRQGCIVALKGLGGFHLACDAFDDAAVRRLRRRKRRSDKPFALMARDLAEVERFCFVSNDDRRALLSWRRPIVIVPRRQGAAISPAVAPGNHTLGVMLPYTPLHCLLFGESPQAPAEFTALVMTSGNLSEEPIVTGNDAARARLLPIADWFLFHNRDIHMRVDDSVVRTFEGREIPLRRSRGYVPQAVDLGVTMTEILACGGQLKNTFCLTKDRYALLSQHIGDLENLETMAFFEETLANMKKLFRVAPRAVAYDLHPQYLSTRFALASAIEPKIGVQHHHAHVASCMAENRLAGKVIGVALDGTGYGTDGRIWGGEFLVADFSGFERRAHLRYVSMSGGDTAVREPWRMGLSYLRDTFPGGLPEIAFQVPPARLELVGQMLEKGIHTVQTSSCGRLFDAVASIIGLRQEASFEAQAAIELEMIAAAGIDAAYEFEISGGAPWQIDMRPAIAGMVRDLRTEKPRSHIAAAFHNTMARVVVEVCCRLRDEERLNRVCLSGGTFQNMKLLKRSVAGLRRRGFEVFLHRQVPPNDGGISLGQAVIANEVLKQERCFASAAEAAFEEPSGGTSKAVPLRNKAEVIPE